MWDVEVWGSGEFEFLFRALFYSGALPLSFLSAGIFIYAAYVANKRHSKELQRVCVTVSFLFGSLALIMAILFVESVSPL